MGEATGADKASEWMGQLQPESSDKLFTIDYLSKLKIDF